MIPFAIGLSEKFSFLQHFMSFFNLFFYCLHISIFFKLQTIRHITKYLCFHIQQYSWTDYRLDIIKWIRLLTLISSPGYKNVSPLQFFSALLVSEEFKHFETLIFVGGNWLGLTLTGVVRGKIIFSLKKDGATIWFTIFWHFCCIILTHPRKG